MVFDWDKPEDGWEKVTEELAEVTAAAESGTKAEVEEEFGDLIFSIVNAARLFGVNPENALEKTNAKFIRRFGHIEQRVAESGKHLRDVTLGEMDEYWNEAKNLGL